MATYITDMQILDIMLNDTDANGQQAATIYNYQCTKDNLHETNIAILYENMVPN